MNKENKKLKKTNLNKRILRALIKADIYSLEDLLNFLDKHGSLQKIDGIGEKYEFQIYLVLKNLWKI